MSRADWQLTCPEEDQRTKQEFKEDCDINKIMRNYRAGTPITHLNPVKPQYLDFSTPFEYQEALNSVIAAQDSFESLPSEVRDRFGDSTNKMLEFLSNPENQEEAIKLGLADPPPEPEPAATPEPARAPAVADPPVGE